MKDDLMLEMDMDLCEKAILKVRKGLFDVYDRPDFWGLCNIAADLLEDEIDSIFNENGIKIYEYEIIHGEMRHNPRIRSDYWELEHTWARVKVDGYTIYLDPTSAQFRDLFTDIPDYYISTKKPKWYYPDENNPAFMVKRDDWTECIRVIQYKLWGRMSDFINNVANHMH